MYAEGLVREWHQEQQGTVAAPTAGAHGLSEDERRIPGAVAAAKAMQAARDPSSGDLDSFRLMGIPTRRIQAVA